MELDRRQMLQMGAAGAAAFVSSPLLAQGRESLEVTIDTRKGAGALPHIWSECAGSDRAAITMRESWRRDLDRWVGETGLKRVRFHGIFNDEMGVLAPSIQNRGKVDKPNFQNVDRVYDGLVEHGVSPLIELSFMPAKLASGNGKFGFYNGNISPPKDMAAWADFIRQFTAHLIERYGRQTVQQWPMEVWNEANLPFFWTSDKQTYFEMYKATATAIKSIDPAIQVGGPATAQAAWLTDFADYCAQNNAPIDFFSTHAYVGDDQKKLFGGDLGIRPYDIIPEAMKRSRQQIEASKFAGRPLWLTEWSSDSPAMIAHIIAGCLPHCQMLSQWTMSLTYEELGVADYIFKEGDMGYGMMAQQVARPSFNTYKLLHALGTERLEAQGPALATRRAGGGIAALVWNLADVTQASGIPGQTSTRTIDGTEKTVAVQFRGARPGQPVKVRFVDQERGSPLPAWRAMGSPQYPTLAQLAQLRKAADIAAPTALRLDRNGRIELTLPPEGVALVELI